MATLESRRWLWRRVVGWEVMNINPDYEHPLCQQKRQKRNRIQRVNPNATFLTNQ